MDLHLYNSHLFWQQCQDLWTAQGLGSYQNISPYPGARAVYRSWYCTLCK